MCPDVWSGFFYGHATGKWQAEAQPLTKDFFCNKISCETSGAPGIVREITMGSLEWVTQLSKHKDASVAKSIKQVITSFAPFVWPQ